MKGSHGWLRQGHAGAEGSQAWLRQKHAGRGEGGEQPYTAADGDKGADKDGRDGDA